MSATQTSSPLKISVGRQAHGCAYQLHPRSRLVVEREYPTTRVVPSVFVGYETQADFEATHGPLWKQIAMILTGLTWSQLKKLGGIAIYDPAAGKVVKKLAA